MKKPTVFLGADVIFAGVAAPSEHGASYVVLRLGEITLIDCVASTQVIAEIERNFKEKLPSKLHELRLIISEEYRGRTKNIKLKKINMLILQELISDLDQEVVALSPLLFQSISKHSLQFSLLSDNHLHLLAHSLLDNVFLRHNLLISSSSAALQELLRPLFPIAQ